MEGTIQSALTTAEYSAIQTAYDFFNHELFGNTLPHVLLTLQRHAKSRGYFSPQRFFGRNRNRTAHELAMNPDHFERSDAEIFSTLVHEMAHVWQETHGHPPKRGYHDLQWAAKMRELGLQPSDTGEKDGKETGYHVTHYIVPGGAYAQAFQKLKASGIELRWKSMPPGSKAAAKASSKTKYTCPDCGLNAWAKPTANLMCGDCEAVMEAGDEFL